MDNDANRFSARRGTATISVRVFSMILHGSTAAELPMAAGVGTLRLQARALRCGSANDSSGLVERIESVLELLNDVCRMPVNRRARFEGLYHDIEPCANCGRRQGEAFVAQGRAAGFTICQCRTT